MGISLFRAEKPHQYIVRRDGQVMTESLFGDRIVRFLYSRGRENAPALFQLVTGARFSQWIGALNFDLPLAPRLLGHRGFLRSCGVDLAECLDPPHALDTPRKIFERKIRYETYRPMTSDPTAVVSPADARVLLGDFRESSRLFIKEKFFSLDELLAKSPWIDTFRLGDFAIFRLTPEKYHYNHTPVAGTVLDIYEISGAYHSCNPSAVVELVTPYSKNRRVVTIFDTEVPGGTGIGKVAMVEVVALMIGQVEQCYSPSGYADPRPAEPGLFVQKGVPKSLFRPGSSTAILIFQPERVHFEDDLVRNLSHPEACSRFTLGFDRALVETELHVRSTIAHKLEEQKIP